MILITQIFYCKNYLNGMSTNVLVNSISPLDLLLNCNWRFSNPSLSFVMILSLKKFFNEEKIT